MKKQIILAVLSSLTSLTFLSSCSDAREVSHVGEFVCVKSFENVIRQEMLVYENVYPKAYLLCQYVNEQDAIDGIMSGETRLAVTGRDLTKAQMKYLKSKKDTQNARSQQVAVDAVAFIINPDNPADTLSLGDVKRILTGQFKNWSQIDPEAPDMPIKVVVDDSKSGLVSYIREKVLDGEEFDKSIVLTADSLTGVFDRVKYHKNYMGIVGSSWLISDLGTLDKEKLIESTNKEEFDLSEINERMKKPGIKTIALMNPNARGLTFLQGYGPTQENIYTGDYPLTRPIYMITTASPAGALGKFYSYVTGVDGQKIMLKSGVMPARLNLQIYEIQ